MQIEKINMMESSIDVLREKVKTYDLFRSTIQARMTALEGKCSILTNSSIRSEKENISSMDTLLSQSHYFSSSLKKIQNTSISNLKKLQDYLTQAMQQQQGKFMQIEERTIAMLSQKEKILRNITLQIDNHAHSIKAIQEWIKTDHNRGNSFTVIEQTIKERLEMLQKNSEMKIFVMDQKIKYLQNLQEYAAGNRKRYAEDHEQATEQLNSFKKEVKRKISDLEEKINDETSKKTSEMINIQSKIDKNTAGLEQLTKRLQSNHESLDQKIKSQINALKQSLNTIPLRTQERQSTLSFEKRPETAKNTQYYDQREILKTPLSQQRKNDINRQRYEEPILRSQGKQEYETLQKKPLPPKKNLFAPEINQSPPEIDRNSREMSGGIRGLLQKSKEKESSRRPQSLSREKSVGKGLPPVREDPFAKKKKTENTKRRRQQSEEEKEEVVYEIDEEGYLMDQEGNYLLNQHGEMIRLSPEEIEQYMEEGEGY